MTHMKPLFLLTISILVSSLNALPQDVRFPLETVGREAALDGLILQPDLAQIEDLLTYQSLRMIEVPLASGATVSVELERISVARHEFGLHVNGVPTPGVVENLGLSVWKGNVVGERDSDVMLAFAPHGCRGWVKIGDELTHLMPQPDANGDWAAGHVLLLTEEALNTRGFALDGDCSTAIQPNAGEISPGNSGGNDPPLESVGTCSMRVCPVAIECDDQLYNIFNDLNAATTYVTTLWSFIGDRYETQANTVLTHPYLNIPTLGNDPWTTQETGGNSVDLLYEFQAAWVGNIPNGCVTAHFMSGAGLGGGVAWLGVLCNDTFNFAVSGNISAGVNFPVVQQPSNWDFMVCAHELGHNFNSPHTHDFCPPLDECAPSGYFGSCQTQQVCTSAGTIMSYCHLCSGGTANITTFFHPTAAGVMTQHAIACLDTYVDASADAPSILVPGVPTPVTLTTTAVPTSPPSLHYSATGTGFQAISMTPGAPGTWSADIPAAACGDTPAFYYSLDDPSCGAILLPAGAPAAVYTALVGNSITSAFDDCEAPSGWTAGVTADDATTGIWERVNPEGTAAAPGDDHSPSGTQCWVTGQGAPGGSLGANDVDGGTTTLLTPIFDLSSGSNPLISYWRWYSNDTGGSPNADTMTVDISDDGGASWVLLEVVGPTQDASGGWIEATFNLTDFVNSTSQVQLRFMASDLGTGSIVEAAIDDLWIKDVSCNSSVGSNYCTPAVTNSSGLPGSIGGTGSDVALDNNLTLTVSGLPDGQFSYFVASQTQGNTPNPGGSQGVLCLGAPIARFNANVLVVSGGQVNLAVDLTAVPLPPSFSHSVMPGESWNFQLWYRDTNPGATSNFSDGLAVTFQ